MGCYRLFFANVHLDFRQSVPSSSWDMLDSTVCPDSFVCCSGAVSQHIGTNKNTKVTVMLLVLRAVSFCRYIYTVTCALNSRSEADRRHSIKKLCVACMSFGLTISLQEDSHGQKLNVVNRFSHLGSTLSHSVVTDDEVNTKITNARLRQT